MNNSGSPKRFESSVSQKPSKGWPKRLLEYSLIALVLITLTGWLSRHMLKDGSQIPNLQLPTLNQTWGQLNWPAEHEKTLVYFFAPWCGICRLSMPGLNWLPEKNLRIVVIALDWQTRYEINEFITDVGYDGEVLLGNDHTRKLFKVSGYPSYYVLDKHGQVIHRDRGVTTPPGLWLKTRL